MGQTNFREYRMWSPMLMSARPNPTYTAATEGLTGVPKVADIASFVLSIFGVTQSIPFS